MSTAGNTLIHEVTAELHEVITNINRAYVDGKFSHLDDPLGERDRLINQALLSARMGDKTLTPKNKRGTLVT